MSTMSNLHRRKRPDESGVLVQKQPKHTVVDSHGRLQLTAEEQHLDEEDPFKFIFTAIALMQEYVSVICLCS
jgi:hypothetical protein